MKAVAILVLVSTGAAAGAVPTPKWACAVSDRPTGRHLFPLGKTSSDTARANLEIMDAKDVRNDAVHLSEAAGFVNNTAQAAADRADAKELLSEAAHESEEADRQLKNAKREAIQKVLAVDENTLPTEVSASTTGVLVVFYAPWCPHCKNFVLEGPDGKPETAPIEVLSTQLEEEKGPKVLKFDVDAGPMPGGYEVQYIPTIYLVKGSKKTVYEGDSGDLPELKKWALSGGAEDFGIDSVFGFHNASGRPKASATQKVSLLQVGAAWRAGRKAKLAALPTGSGPVGYPTPIDPHGKNLALTSVANTPDDVSPLGKLSDELDGSLEVDPMVGISSWVSDAKPVAGADGVQAPRPTEH